MGPYAFVGDNMETHFREFDGSGLLLTFQGWHGLRGLMKLNFAGLLEDGRLPCEDLNQFRALLDIDK